MTTGGTGFSIRDTTPESVTPLLEKEAPGIVHALLQVLHTIGLFQAPYFLCYFSRVSLACEKHILEEEIGWAGEVSDGYLGVLVMAQKSHYYYSN